MRWMTWRAIPARHYLVWEVQVAMERNFLVFNFEEMKPGTFKTG